MEPQKYILKVETGHKSGAGTNADVYIRLNGSSYDDEFNLDCPGTNLFEEGATNSFLFEAKTNLGNIDSLFIEIGKSDNDSPPWLLYRIEVSTYIGTDLKKWTFFINDWFSPILQIEDPNYHEGAMDHALIYSSGIYTGLSINQPIARDFAKRPIKCF
ncbi:PLAT/LH2 domain-containing protein [Priestia megaterium]|uniref:PLAT/LH2 domain-containing protein n=1 Tax=Priestia megaterium TaxID=1404 RepID=UPI001C529623|nr:PLAT/LH2 domain-containing protein [Priestia megaterium]MBW0933923.1 hypothetical protein [Priestia megaterium]